MKEAPHAYRTELTTGGGFPDVLLIHGDRHSLVELKMFEVGVSGDKKLSTVFKDSQYPWYWNYITNGGTRLFVVFKLNKGYSILRITKELLLEFDAVKYSGLKNHEYQEFRTLKELILAHFA